MTTKHSALLALLAIGCLGLSTWTSQSSLGQDEFKPTVRPDDVGVFKRDVPPPVYKAPAEKEQSLTIGRYQLSVIQSGQGFLLDTATGQVWSRFFTGNNSRNWTDQGKPDFDKGKVAGATPAAPQQRVVQEEILRRGPNGVETSEIVERTVPVEGEPTAPRAYIPVPVTGDERPRAAPVLLDQESEALVREITEALTAARTKVAKERLGNDLRKALKEAKKWNELEALPPQTGPKIR